MNLLKRALAPIVPEAWNVIDEEARDVLRDQLAGRKLVELDGPHGWRHAAVNTGRLHAMGDREGVIWHRRDVLPLVELRAPFTLSISDLDSLGRGQGNPDLDPVVAAARAIAAAEDHAIFHGVGDAGVQGILEASPHEAIVVPRTPDYSSAILRAIDRLRRAGINGPYAVALGARLYDEVYAATEDGYPISKQIERVLAEGGRIVRAAAIDVGAVLSVGCDDYRLVIGQDLSVGYQSHEGDALHLYITESFTFRNLAPEAAVELRRPA